MIGSFMNISFKKTVFSLLCLFLWKALHSRCFNLGNSCSKVSVVQGHIAGDILDACYVVLLRLNLLQLTRMVDQIAVSKKISIALSSPYSRVAMNSEKLNIILRMSITTAALILMEYLTTCCFNPLMMTV